MSTAQQVGGAEKILHVAICLFAQKGYDATSTREIVEAAGVTKPMLYYYFGSKEGLCKAAIKSFAEPFLAELRQIAAETCPPRQLLVDFVWKDSSRTSSRSTRRSAPCSASLPRGLPRPVSCVPAAKRISP